MTRREMLDRVALVGAGLFAAPLHEKFGADRDAELKHIAENVPDKTQRVETLESMRYVVVTPEGPRDGGHFGRHTPETKTSGIQEALEYAKAHKGDVYITGGAVPEAFVGGAVYGIDETLRVPWMQDFRLDGGEYLIRYRRTTGDAVVIDSQMNCRLKFGLIWTASDGAVVRLKPERPGPDNIVAIVCSEFQFNGLVGSGDVWGKEGSAQKGIGLWLDASTGIIVSNDIFVIEANACDKGIYMTGTCGNNWVRSPFVHGCNTGLQMGDTSTPNVNNNKVEANIFQGLGEKIGARIFGQKNLLTLNVTEMAPERDIVFEAESRDNLVIAYNLPSGITNRAVIPTNRIIATWPVGFNVSTPPFPASGEDVVNRNPYPVEIIILAMGEVSDWTLTDGNGVSQAVSSALSAGQHFVLQPGERIRFTYTVAPSWKWKAQQ